MVRNTSKMAHLQNVLQGRVGKQEMVIVQYLAGRKTPASRREIGKNTSLELGAIAGRVNSLVKKNIVNELSKIKCPISGRMVHPVELNTATIKNFETK